MPITKYFIVLVLIMMIFMIISNMLHRRIYSIWVLLLLTFVIGLGEINEYIKCIRESLIHFHSFFLTCAAAIAHCFQWNIALSKSKFRQSSNHFKNVLKFPNFPFWILQSYKDFWWMQIMLSWLPLYFMVLSWYL